MTNCPTINWITHNIEYMSFIHLIATFIGIPVSAALGATTMTGAVSNGIISVLTKKYQKKLKKVTK